MASLNKAEELYKWVKNYYPEYLSELDLVKKDFEKDMKKISSWKISFHQN